MNGLEIRLADAHLFCRPIPLCRPFKFGIVELRELQHLVVRARFTIGGETVTGWASENLVPKWFEKVAGRALEEDVRLLREAVGRVGEVAVGMGASPSPYEFWRQLYYGAGDVMPEVAGLVRQLGVSLLERAVIDARCRQVKTPFWQLIRGGLGIPDGPWTRALPTAPSEFLRVRHTVGMGDDLAELGDILRKTEIRGLKVKLGGNAEADEERLAKVMESCAGVGIQLLTVDGNENYGDAQTWREFLKRLASGPRLATARAALAWVEQPLIRHVALAEEVVEVLAEFPDIPHVIDESDASPDDLPRALKLGYAGTTHKNCKGVFKSIRAVGLLADHERNTGRKTILSGEDLTIVAPWSQAADLAVAAAIGVVDIERNGQHFADGLGALSREAAAAAVREHPDLYQPDDRCGARLRIEGGAVSLGSVNRAPLGSLAEPDVAGAALG